VQSMMPARPLSLLLLLLPLLAGGCVRVKASQRGALASSAMESPWAVDGLAAEYDAKLVETQTAGGSAGGAPGGGCGCTQ
jgi:Domain of unknown function (DUF4266)